FKEDNLDAPTRLMVTEKRGEELQAKLQSFKDQMLAIVPEKKEEFEKSLPLDLKKPTGTRSAGNDDWASAYFRMTPTIAAITILSKFQNDVKNSEAQIVDYCHNQIGQVEVIFDAFQAFAGTNSKYLMPGEELEITAGIGSFSKAAQPIVYINGTPQQLNADGAAVWKTRVEGVGNKVVNVKIEYTKPDGTKDVAERKVEYTVGVPSGASIFLEKMNVMYLGVDNPVTISGGSVGSEKVSVTFTGGTITKAGGDRYIAKPSKTGEEKIVVTADGKRYEFPIRCKLLPDPAVMVGTSSGGPMSAATFKAQGGLIARLKDSDFDASFKVVSYTLGAKGGPLSNYQQFNNEGPRWTGNAGNLIERVGPGSDVFFDDIRVQGPDGRVRSIPSIAFQLK
ncbi:MAG TPA: GldM family protein, partial [Parasegetibacter sp.]